MNLALTIAELRAAGATTLRELASGLNARSIPTVTGKGTCSPVQVSRSLVRSAL